MTDPPCGTNLLLDSTRIVIQPNTWNNQSGPMRVQASPPHHTYPDAAGDQPNEPVGCVAWRHLYSREAV